MELLSDSIPLCEATQFTCLPGTASRSPPSPQPESIRIALSSPVLSSEHPCVWQPWECSLQLSQGTRDSAPLSQIRIPGHLKAYVVAALAVSGIGNKRMKNIKKIISYLKVYTQPNYPPGMREIKTFSRHVNSQRICLPLILFINYWRMCVTIMRKKTKRHRDTEDPTA